MNNPPARDYRGAARTKGMIAGGEAIVPRTPDNARPRRAKRRIHWHHVLVRRRRWAEELDRICDPWSFAAPVDDGTLPLADLFGDGRLDVPARDRRGRELVAVGWAP